MVYDVLIIIDIIFLGGGYREFWRIYKKAKDRE
jgi:hypothetical protein